MPIKDADFGKYKRPGIFFQEIDQSIVQLPVQNVLINLVPGFSKKGPFNTPIYVTNPTDFSTIFGDDDTRLENKGSFFHKTVKQMLKSGPVWALNLLATDPNRDKVDWQSIGVSASKNSQNSNVIRSAYESFYNRQDFWERDTDSFLNVVKANNYGVQDTDRLFHITNMGYTDISIFMFKSSITGFDVTAEAWYGDRTKVPSYLDYRDWISDYLVTVIVVAGDWSDYKTLSNDTTYGKYFDKNGLIKNKVSAFLNENTVSVLANYDCSLIPYFKDLNNRDMYIKNIINNDTDKTGLFCTYNEDVLLEADFRVSSLDIIGGTIVGEDVSSINFMSYNTILNEQISYSQTYLDSTNNVITNNNDSYNTDFIESGVDVRSGAYVNGNIFGVSYNNTTTLTGPTGTTLSTTFTINPNAYYVLNGVLITGNTFVVNASNGVSYPNGSRYDVLYLTNDNTINVLEGTESNSNTGAILPDYLYSLDSTIIIGYVYISNSGSTATLTYYPVSIDSNGYVPIGTTSGYEYEITNGFDTQNYMNIQFNGTSGQTGIYNDYNSLRQSQSFYEMYDNITTKSVFIHQTGGNFIGGDKDPVLSVSSTESTSNQNANIKIYVNSNTPSLCHSGNTFLLYYVDNEFLLHENSVDTSTLITRYDVLGTSDSNGIVATYSQLYLDYYNGNINNYDYFYVNNDSGYTKIFLDMFIDQSEILTVNFLSSVNPPVSTPVLSSSWGTTYNHNLIIFSDRSNWKQSVQIDQWYGDDLTDCRQISIDKNRYSEITIGNFLTAYYDESYWAAPNGEGYLEGSVPRKITRIINIKNDPTNVNNKYIYTDSPIKIDNYNVLSGSTPSLQTFTYPEIDDYVDEYKALVLSPFTVNVASIPDGTDTRQNSILDIIGIDTNLGKALADKNKISWRYLVDSFGLGLTPMTGYGSKQQLADICGLKLNCLGFISMPSAKIFRESTNPSFINADYTLNIQYVSAGADDSKNPDYYYQFAQPHTNDDNINVDGRSCVGYFFPYIRIYDNGIPKWVPPAAYAATTYMQKFVSNTAGMVPWTICAGITNGRVQTITKTEMDFNSTDLEYLHGMNANPIVYKLNNGYCINDEVSAQVFPYSSLSFLHSREVLIELENRMYDMLLKYQWQFNTAEIRAEIKYNADKICKDMLDNNALYDFWNVCDESNNTDYVIDLQMGVLDTYVELIKGMGIIVNNITIMKKGDIQSLGFH